MGGVTTPTIYHKAMAVADTEYSQVLAGMVRRFTVHTRDGTSFRLAFETGKVAAPVEPYFTVLANDAYREGNLEVKNLTLYFACGVLGKDIEIIVWK